MTRCASGWWGTPSPLEYRSKPVTVLALPYDGTPESRAAIMAWLDRAPAHAKLQIERGGAKTPDLTIEQPDQDPLRFTPGDVLVRRGGRWHKIPGPEFDAQFDPQVRALPVYE